MPLLWFKLRKLRSADYGVRWETVVELGHSGNRRAVPALIETLKDSSDLVREAAACALGELKDPRAAIPLEGALADPSERVVKAAAKALPEVAGHSAVEALLRALVRGTTGAGSDLFTALDRADRDWKISKHARDLVPVLIPRLRDPELGIRRAALELLYVIADDRAVDSLLGVLNDPDDVVRIRAVQTLGRIGGRTAVSPLVKALNDRCGYVQQNAATALGLIGGMDQVEPLIAALENGDSCARQEAATALGRLADVRAIGPLVRYCLDYRPEGCYRNDPTAPVQERDQAAGRVEALTAILSRAVGEVSTEQLLTLAALEDTSYHLRVEYDTPGYGDGADDFAAGLDFDQVRRLATQELARRGIDRGRRA